MKKNIFLWSLYDFANSIIMIVFLFYFSQWLVVDSGRPDWWYNATLVVSSLLLILAGQRLDVTRNKLSGLRITSIWMFIFYLSTAIVMLFIPLQAFLAAVLFTLAMYFYLLSFVYYTPMINDISDETNRGWISGLGLGANYIGQVFGLLVTLPFATGTLYLFGAPGRAQTLVPAIILFAASALPMLMKYKEATPEIMPEPVSIKEEYKKITKTISHIFSIRSLALLVVGYFLFSDALLTFSNNFPIYLEKAFGASDSIKTYLTAGILIFSGVGSVIFGKMADKKGTKFTLSCILVSWVIFFPLLALATTLKAASIICLIAGFFFGPVWGVSRAMVSELAPREIEGSAFSFYTIAERFATFIGPITWSIVLAVTKGQGTASYSYALMGMGVLVLLGLFFIRKIKLITNSALV